ncbi:hypothetical protein LTR93_001543 [Exophiala xenobiotica]|nr:hypothetical protein LTR93_001543 [Exophiala xenobiotica]
MAQAAPSRKFTTLESLPEHLLREICLYLDSPNLTNFSLVSKFCKGISTSCRKWEIRFQVSTPAKLKQDVEFWMSRLNVFNRARVTKVAIEGQMELSEAARDRRVRHGYSIEEEMLLFPFPEHAEFDAWAPLSNFLSELPSLAKLLYQNFVDDGAEYIFNAILAHHHSKLAGLSVIQTAGLRISPLVATDIVQLTRQQSCFGQLADLRIAIPRSRGDRNEALIYHTLGGLPKLQTLQLFLDASPTGSSLDEWESRKFAATSDGWLRNGHVRDVLINMALDETLARSIFHTIASAKGSSSLPLERLRLHPLWAARNGFYHWRTNLCKVTGYVAQPWEVERGERDDQREILFVRRIYAFGGEDHEAFLKSYLNYWEKQQQENTSLSARMEEIFSRAWPNWQQKSDDWRKAWHSYPLATIA